MKHLLFVFLDGVGIGADDPASNPFLQAKMPTWRALAGDDWPTLSNQTPRQTRHATLLGADATLGVAGIPQSGTGTTALLTGHNAPAVLGRHEGPYPPSQIRPLLQEHNLLSRVSAQNGRCAFANAYPPFYLKRIERGTARRTTCLQAALAAGVPIRTYEDLIAGNALSGWITNEHWRKVELTVPDITPFVAGQNLAQIALQHEVTLFEYFHTDHMGHRPNMTKAHATLDLLDTFLDALLKTLDPTRDLLILASDHGNFEALDHSKHTRNPTLVTLWGHNHAEVASKITHTTDIVPALLAWLGL